MEGKNKNKPITADQVALIPTSDYLTYKQAVAYMGHGDDWFYRMVKEFDVIKTATGYYFKPDLDRIKRGDLNTAKGERVANGRLKAASSAA